MLYIRGKYIDIKVYLLRSGMFQLQDVVEYGSPCCYFRGWYANFIRLLRLIVT